jgi:hypothetical protein
MVQGRQALQKGEISPFAKLLLLINNIILKVNPVFSLTLLSPLGGEG